MHWPIVSFETTDKLILDGLLVESPKKSSTAYIFLHGLSSVFYTNIPLLSELTKLAERNAAAFFSFNTRGTGSISRFRKIDKRKRKGYRSITIGGAYEEFTECVYDIEGAINFLQSKGYQKVVLIGHSTGCQKSVYYLAKRSDPRITKLILLAPASDRDVFQKELKGNFDNARIYAQKMVSQGKGDEFMPSQWSFEPLSAKRFLSLVERNSLENTFPYTDKGASWWAVKKITIPTLVIFGEQEEYITPKPSKVLGLIQKKLKNASFVSTVLIGETGHSFANHEGEVTTAIASFLAR